MMRDEQKQESLLKSSGVQDFITGKLEELLGNRKNFNRFIGLCKEAFRELGSNMSQLFPAKWHNHYLVEGERMLEHQRRQLDRHIQLQDQVYQGIQAQEIFCIARIQEYEVYTIRVAEGGSLKIEPYQRSGIEEKDRQQKQDELFLVFVHYYLLDGKEKIELSRKYPISAYQIYEALTVNTFLYYQRHQENIKQQDQPVKDFIKDNSSLEDGLYGFRFIMELQNQVPTQEMVRKIFLNPDFQICLKNQVQEDQLEQDDRCSQIQGLIDSLLDGEDRQQRQEGSKFIVHKILENLNFHLAFEYVTFYLLQVFQVFQSREIFLDADLEQFYLFKEGQTVKFIYFPSYQKNLNVLAEEEYERTGTKRRTMQRWNSQILYMFSLIQSQMMEEGETRLEGDSLEIQAFWNSKIKGFYQELYLRFQKVVNTHRGRLEESINGLEKLRPPEEQSGDSSQRYSSQLMSIFQGQYQGGLELEEEVKKAHEQFKNASTEGKKRTYYEIDQLLGRLRLSALPGLMETQLDLAQILVQKQSYDKKYHYNLVHSMQVFTNLRHQPYLRSAHEKYILDSAPDKFDFKKQVEQMFKDIAGRSQNVLGSQRKQEAQIQIPEEDRKHLPALQRRFTFQLKLDEQGQGSGENLFRAQLTRFDLENPQKPLTIYFSVEYQDAKKAVKVRVWTTEMLYQFETQDDLSFLLNTISLEDRQVTLETDEARRLIFSQTFLAVEKQEYPLKLILVLDGCLTAMLCVQEYYQKNIQHAKSSKEVKKIEYLMLNQINLNRSQIRFQSNLKRQKKFFKQETSLFQNFKLENSIKEFPVLAAKYIEFLRSQFSNDPSQKIDESLANLCEPVDMESDAQFIVGYIFRYKLNLNEVSQLSLRDAQKKEQDQQNLQALKRSLDNLRQELQMKDRDSEQYGRFGKLLYKNIKENLRLYDN